jgi:hypothetical protein
MLSARRARASAHYEQEYTLNALTLPKEKRNSLQFIAHILEQIDQSMLDEIEIDKRR